MAGPHTSDRSAPAERAGAKRARAAAPVPESAPRRRRHHLSKRMRALLFVVGWLLVAVGVAGLVLPGIQGVVTILAGLAVLSVVSRTAHGWIRRLLSRWPGLRKRVERLRWRLRRRFGRRRADAAAAGEDSGGGRAG